MAENTKEIKLTQSNNGFKLIPSSLEEAHAIASFIAMSSAVPSSYVDYSTKTAKKREMAIAILAGAEYGFSALASLQNIIIVNGKAVMSADMMRSIVLRSPECEYLHNESNYNEKGELTGHTIEVKRRGHPKYIATFTVENAKRAGLWNKSNKNGTPSIWQMYPERMLSARCTGHALRDKFSDLLQSCGYTVEEAQDSLIVGEHESNIQHEPDRSEQVAVTEKKKPETSLEYVNKLVDSLMEDDAL